METSHFSLGDIEKNRLVNVIRIVFGSVCLALAAFWLIFNIKSAQNSGTLWITILFLTGFGLYLIWAGFGKAERFIEIRSDNIVLKKYIFLQPVTIPAVKTEKIEFFPLKVIFLLKSGTKVLLRLGTMYYESSRNITDEITKYAEENRILTEAVQEEI